MLVSYHSTETTCTQPYDNAQTQVHARGLMDQEPYIMFLQIDTKELYLTKALRRHKISTIQNVDMSETADGSSSLVVEFQDTKKKRLRIRVATATQASEWTTTIVNLIKQEKILVLRKLLQVMIPPKVRRLRVRTLAPLNILRTLSMDILIR